MYRFFIIVTILLISGCSSKNNGQSEICVSDSIESREAENGLNIFDKADWETDSICYNNNQLIQYGFERFKKKYTYSIYGNETYYKINVDYPQNDIPYASILQNWIRQQIAESVGFEKKIKYRKSGKKYSIEDIAKQSADFYFNNLAEV